MNLPAPERHDITGLILAGGRASRMGGRDKGLVPLHGAPLALWALRRLAPQVAGVMINANRHAEDYARLGAPVHADAWPDFQGPLAGFATGLAHLRTPWLLTVPCDTPLFPRDLAQRLGQTVQTAGSLLAMAATLRDDGSTQAQPVFCLMHRSLAPSLAESLACGERSAMRWAERMGGSLAPFDQPGDDPLAFRNVNTPGELLALQALVARPPTVPQAT